MKPASARGSKGNSRRMSLALPVSMYLVLISGSVTSWKRAQCGQVMEAYSTIVTGASALPSTMSGSAPGSSSAAISTLPSEAGAAAEVEDVVVCETPGDAGSG